MQLEFPCLDVDSLRAQLESATAQPLHLRLTDNSSTMMSFKHARVGKAAELRLHRMFLSAGRPVVDALAKWLTGARPRAAGRVLDEFIEAHQHLVVTRAHRPGRLQTRGLHYDLQALYHEVNAAEFSGNVDAPITWGRFPGGRKRRRSIRLGSYTPEDNVIRIHPHLDQAEVPEFFVRYIVFHEMLHAHVGFETTPSGRRSVHTPAFNRLERAYGDYERAVAWHDNPRNLSRLLNGRRRSA